MVVWVVSYHIPYESGGPIAAFATKELAREYANKYEAEQGHGHCVVTPFAVESTPAKASSVINLREKG